VIRVAAVGDVHVDADVVGRFRPALSDIAEHADVLLIAGDLTRHGTLEEAKCVLQEFGGLPVPVVVVLGNHDYQSDLQMEMADLLTDGGLTVLEGTGVVLPIRNQCLGVAGVKGFGGGFPGRTAAAFGEPEMKAFALHGELSARALEVALRALDCDIKVALTHYSPVAETLAGEPLEIYPFLGSYLLGQAIDSAPTALAVHGHAHHGSERGTTPGGVRVRNVAHPVIKQAYSVFHLTSANVRH
jgi:Icc-related predicted phosphoesterase